MCVWRPDVLVPTDEEQRLLECLSTEWWSKNATAPVVRDVVVLKSEMTRAGVEAHLKITGNSTNATRQKLEDGVDFLRVLLDVEDDHPLVVLPNGRASQVKIAIRTRRVTEEMDMFWHPGRVGLGVDSVTGDVVDIPFQKQLQVSGAKGSGKSWAMRPMMARAVILPEISPVFADPKIVEGTWWEGLMPVYYPGEFEEMLDSATDDMHTRAELMRKERSTVWRPEFGPYRIYIVDEGREFLGNLRRIDLVNQKLARARRRSEEESEVELSPGDGECLDKLLRISSMGRAWGVFLWWATQYPIVSGKNPGIDTNVDANADYRFSLRVSKPGHAAVALGEDADYGPHLLTADDRNRGFGYLGGYGPSLIQTWTVTDEMISLLGYPDHGRGKWPRDIALKAIQEQPGAVWTPDLLTSRVGCGRVQASRFLRTFSREGLMTADRDAFRLVV
jgi:S-DNA-T family DNA segregation ATPase FtsK/SpoIIIE